MDQKMLIVDADEYDSQIVQPLADLNQKFEHFLKAQHTPETVLSRREAAKFLGITLVTLRDWTKRGLLKSGNIGSRVFYKKSDLINAIS